MQPLRTHQESENVCMSDTEPVSTEARELTLEERLQKATQEVGAVLEKYKLVIRSETQLVPLEDIA